MKIAVVGASSFIGKYLIAEFHRKKWEIIAIVRNANVHKGFFSQYDNVTLVECDMHNYSELANLIDRANTTIYLTWNGTRGADRSNYEKQRKNFEQSMIAIDAIVKAGCKKILTAGSQAEYGLWFLDRKCNETDEAKPNTEYGKFKLKFYCDAKKYCDEHDVKLVEPRFFSLYGPGDFAGTMIISILNKMINNEPCDLTECKQIWDFLYIDDAIAGLVKLIEDDNACGVYNFGSGVSFPLKHYIEEMYRVTGSKRQLNYGAVPYPVTGMVNVNPCVDKLKNLGWKAKVPFEEGMKRTFKDIRNQNKINFET